MKYTHLGDTGLKVSRLCLGTMTYGDTAQRAWAISEADALPFFEKALDIGINFFDTADVYSNGASEEIVGRALRKLVPDREDVVIATKCFGGTHDRKPNRWGLSRKHILDAADRSLRRLGVDYIDLYQIHRFDPATPIEETLSALDHLVRVGKVRYLGASSMFAWQFARYLYRADALGFTRFVAMQNHYNLLYREEEREMLPLCRVEGVGVIPWSPLARGRLAGPRRRQDGATLRARTDTLADSFYPDPNDGAVIERNVEVAHRLGYKPIQLALAWLLANPAVTAPIIGASRIEHLDDALAALQIELSAADIASLEEPYLPHWISGHS
jgi:aryl-alcohol dehydrogenase (NADP+)